MTGRLLYLIVRRCGWLVLLVLGAARRGPSWYAAAPAENPGILGVGRCHHSRLAVHPQAPASPFEQGKPSLRPKEGQTPGPVEPRPPARQSRHRHFPPLNPAPEHGSEAAQRQPSTSVKNQGWCFHHPVVRGLILASTRWTRPPMVGEGIGQFPDGNLDPPTAQAFTLPWSVCLAQFSASLGRL
jgi:hypothetical protein